MNELVMLAAFASPTPAPAPDFAAFPPPVRDFEPAKKRVKISGFWFDTLPGGRLQWCQECNGSYPAGGIPGLVVVDWNGARPGGSGVAAPVQPFRAGPVWNPTHQCPRCGRSEYTISGYVGRNHTHTCRSCGTVWQH